MAVRQELSAAALRAAMSGFRDALRAHQESINRLNVYPVPDGDTGTNMALTLQSVMAELDGVEGDAMADVCHAISHGSLMGARGNSGVITCQILRGLTAEIRDLSVVEGRHFADALAAASKASYEAVQKPTEGTILTVLREASEAAVDAADGAGDLLAVLDAARVRGGESLERTPELLPVLAEAGVVDAGGAGFLLLLDALLHVVDGRAVPEPANVAPLDSAAGATAGGPDRPEGDAHDVSDLRYEVMYFLEAPDETIPAFKDVWAGLGDSIVVVGGDGIWNCHVHTDDIGAAIEAAIEIGRPRQIRVTDLFEEVEEERWVREAAAAAEDDPPHDPVGCGVVAVATGDGIRRIFHSLRVQRVVTGGQSMNPSTQQLLDAVEAVQADHVIILPNNKNIIAVAEKVNDLTSKSVRVVPTRSVTEGFGALLAYDPEAEADDNQASMAEMASSVVAAEVTQAVRDSSCDVGPIAEGDFLGIGPDGIVAVEHSVVDAACELLSTLVAADHEIVTIIEGDGSSAGDTRRITEWLTEHKPDVEPEVHHGGQPLYPYLFGIE